MDVLLIGGTGLISTGITRQLVGAGHDVIHYNRGETDADVPILEVETVRGDRTDYDRFERRMADVDVDCVVDMVCFTRADAESAIRAFGDRIEQYVLCSTVDVYSRPVESNPVTEEAPRHPATSEYGRGKAAAEDAVVEAHGRGAFAGTILRPWDTYGEGGRLNHTFGKGTYYVDRIREGDPVVVHGDGTSLWASCHRDDVARAFVNAVGNPRAYGETYHVTGEECHTWDQYHRKVAAALDAPEPDLVHVPTDVLVEVFPERTDGLRKHYRYSTVFDNAKARRDLDFAYTIPFEEGVRRVVSWLDDHDEITPADAEPRDDRLIEAWREATDEVVAALD